MVTRQQAYCRYEWFRNVVVANVDTQEVQHLTDDGQSIFVFWHDAALAVEPAEKLSTSWGAIKGQVIDSAKVRLMFGKQRAERRRPYELFSCCALSFFMSE